MTSKSGKSDEKIKDKLKSLFGFKDKHAGLGANFQKPSSREFVFSPEILKDIGPESPSNNRMKTIKEFSDVVLKKKLEENAVEAVWCSIQDLVLPQAQPDRRHVALHFLQCLLDGQSQHLGMLRRHFFNVIQSLTLPENLMERLELFKVLSENGRNLVEFEEETGPFLVTWTTEMVAGSKLSSFLPLLVSVVKFNAAYMDEAVVSGLVKQICALSCQPQPDEEMKLTIDFLDAVVRYSYLPTDCLHDCVGGLCRMLNIPKYCEASWELMRKILGTYLGHSSIYTMCIMLQDRREPLDYKLLRGAIFYIGMALWGSRKVPKLKHTPAAVLPSFLHVLSSGNPMITYEVILSVGRLVKKYGKELTSSTWDIVLEILEMVFKQLEASQDLSADPRARSDLHDTLTTIEHLYEKGQYSGPVNRFFAIIEMCAAKRPENSVILLISHHAQSIHPGRENWIINLYQLLDKFFRNDARTNIRLKALDVLSSIVSINKEMYEDDLINKVVLPHLCHIEADAEVNVRKVSVEMLLGVAHSCSPGCFMDIIAIIEKVISRPLVGRPLSPYPSPDSAEMKVVLDEAHLVDVKAAVIHLADLFKTRLYTFPPGVSLKLYDMLVSHLSSHYAEPKDYSSLTAACVRKTIIECLLNLRADGFHRLGFFERSPDNPLRYSPYVTCKRSEGEVSPPSSPVILSPGPAQNQWASMTLLEYTQTFSLFLQCLENEKDWEVLKAVLENLPILLQNKTIILATRRNMVDVLSSKLCAMVNDRQIGYPEKLQGVPGKFTRSDFHAYVFPVLASMVTYHNYLDRNRQRELIKCLEFGMVSKCAKLCVNALRLCTLEMQEVMMRQLPSILLQLSKISATVSMAIPVLAFLSSIVRSPKMYANFVEEEYMSVFAIALPYTNPFKFSHYTVSLAHHVIAIWFIRCRMPFRKGFVQFIQKGLKANVLQQFEENARQALQNQNQDSSDRARSGSYSEAALRSRRRMQSGSAVSRSDISAPVDEKLSQFHRELTETCTDVMARYAFGNFSPLPHRSHMAEFLLAGGQTQTWLVGNKLITITTSGSGKKVGNSGVCDKCQAAYHMGESRTGSSKRRRHRSAVAFSRSASTVEPPQLSSKDDSVVTARSSLDDMSLEVGMPGQDVAVQTGSSLTETGTGIVENEPLESLILGMKGADLKRPALNVCNCWVTNWAEIYIRAPSGNMSWMMRIENEAGLYVEDSQVPDITMLFASMGKKRSGKVTRHSQRIESGSIGEEEYESLYAQHFPDYMGAERKGQGMEEVKPEVVKPSTITEEPAGSLGFTVQLDTVDSPDNGQTRTEMHNVSQALQIPSSDSAANHDISPGSLRRSNSSPSILSGSSDTLSPRESISDIVQFGPLPKLDKLKLATAKSVDVPEPTSQDNGAKKVDESKSTESKDTDIVKVQQATKINETDKKVADSTDGTVSSTVGAASDKPKTETKNAESQSAIAKDIPVHREYSSMLTKQLSPSPASSEASSTQDEVGELPSNLHRVRGHTISVVQRGQVARSGQSDTKEGGRVGINPSFVFLQLYHSGQIHVNEAPLLLQNNENTERAILMLDHIYPYETHKIGVIYVGPGQTKDEKSILSNAHGSDRYMKFVQSLGSLVRLKDCDPKRIYLGGLDNKGTDGNFTYCWHDESTQMIFHIATLMPRRDNDPNYNMKKRHIGNDYVTVVYNNSGEDYKIGVMKGQFNYVNIVIKPLDYESNAVTLQAKEVPFQDQITTDIAEILGHKDTKIISDSNLAMLVRQIAIHCNLASMVLQRQQSQPQDPFANNWLERLRKIRRIRTNLVVSPTQSADPQAAGRPMEDFTEYV